jgi:hypothetical protein
VYRFLLVMCYTVVTMGGVSLCHFGHSQELELSRALGSSQRLNRLSQRSTEGFKVCAKGKERISRTQWVPQKLKEGSTYSETTKTVILAVCGDAQGQLVV